MATNGENRWPPVGRFGGRLRGGFHGHRQQATDDRAALRALGSYADYDDHRRPARPGAIGREDDLVLLVGQTSTAWSRRGIVESYVSAIRSRR